MYNSQQHQKRKKTIITTTKSEEKQEDNLFNADSSEWHPKKYRVYFVPHPLGRRLNQHISQTDHSVRNRFLLSCLFEKDNSVFMLELYNMFNAGKSVVVLLKVNHGCRSIQCLNYPVSVRVLLKQTYHHHLFILWRFFFYRVTKITAQTGR